MLCFLTERKLKPGSYDAFRGAWEPDRWPAGLTRAYHLRATDDPDHVISFGFFEGGLEDLARMRDDAELAAMRERQLAEIDRHVDSTGVDAVFEVAEEVTPPAA